jgi:hypothetical protein
MPLDNGLFENFRKILQVLDAEWKKFFQKNALQDFLQGRLK